MDWLQITELCVQTALTAAVRPSVINTSKHLLGNEPIRAAAGRGGLCHSHVCSVWHEAGESWSVWSEPQIKLSLPALQETLTWDLLFHVCWWFMGQFCLFVRNFSVLNFLLYCKIYCCYTVNSFSFHGCCHWVWRTVKYSDFFKSSRDCIFIQ